MEPPVYYLRLSLALLIPLLLLKLFRKRGRGDNGLRLPPGPWRRPVIGSPHHLAGNQLVHHVLADLACRLKAPLMYLKLGRVAIVVATSPEAAREIMGISHRTSFMTRPWSPTIKIVDTDGRGLTFGRHDTQWGLLRMIFIRDLLSHSPYRVQSFRHVWEDEVWRFVAAIAAAPSREPVNVSERISMLITGSALRIIIGGMFGGRFRRSGEFLRFLEEGPKLVAGFSLNDLFPSSWIVSLIRGTSRLGEGSHRKSFELIEYVIEQLEERREATFAMYSCALEEREDLVDMLLRIREEGGKDVALTTGMIKAVILDLYGAGRETSATTLQWAMSELMRHPNVMQKAQAEVCNNLRGEPNVTMDDMADLKYLWLVIKETMRLHPPAPLLIPRKAMKLCEILGFSIPKGTTVLVNAWAIGRDHGHWEDPEEFKPERLEHYTL